MERENEQFEELPQALIEQLKAADRALPLITSRVDREILQMAQAHFEQRRRRGRVSGPAWAAIAATVLITFLVVTARTPPTDAPVTLYADVDQSGRVDIADVLALARSGPSDSLSQAEIDAFARHIVSLNPVGDAS